MSDQERKRRPWKCKRVARIPGYTPEREKAKQLGVALVQPIREQTAA